MTNFFKLAAIAFVAAVSAAGSLPATADTFTVHGFQGTIYGR